PELGYNRVRNLKQPKSDKSDFGRGEGARISLLLYSDGAISQRHIGWQVLVRIELLRIALCGRIQAAIVDHHRDRLCHVLLAHLERLTRGAGWICIERDRQLEALRQGFD